MKNLAEIKFGPLRGFGSLGLENKTPSDAPLIFNKFISTVIGVITIVAFIWFTLQFVIGAVSMISAGGDKNKLTEAKNKLTMGIIGLVVTVAAIFIIDLIGSLLGLKFILNPALFIYEITVP